MGTTACHADQSAGILLFYVYEMSVEEQVMTCPYCQGDATQGLERVTALGYRLFRCRPCRRTFNGMRQDSERNRTVARASLRWCPPDRAYAACSSAHTSPHRFWKSRRWSARETVSFRCRRKRKWSRSSSWAVQKRAADANEPKPRIGS